MLLPTNGPHFDGDSTSSRLAVRTWVHASRRKTERRAWSYSAEAATAGGGMWSCSHVHTTPLLAYQCVLDWKGVMGIDRRHATRRILAL